MAHAVILGSQGAHVGLMTEVGLEAQWALGNQRGCGPGLLWCMGAWVPVCPRGSWSHGGTGGFRSLSLMDSIGPFSPCVSIGSKQGAYVARRPLNCHSHVFEGACRPSPRAGPCLCHAQGTGSMSPNQNCAEGSEGCQNESSSVVPKKRSS
jgi:hypothetical protein